MKRKRIVKKGSETNPFPQYNKFQFGDARKISNGDKVIIRRVGAIDPGIKNCAIRVEERELAIPTDAKDEKEKEVLIKHRLSETPDKVTTIIQEKFDFTVCPHCPNTKCSSTCEFNAIGSNIFTRITAHMTKSGIREALASCDWILVESQLYVAKAVIIRICQHLITFISTFYNVPVFEVNPRLKSHAFGQPPMKKPELKKWAIIKAIELAEKHQDEGLLKVMKAKGKKDDHADVACYTASWFIVMSKGTMFEASF